MNEEMNRRRAVITHRVSVMLQRSAEKPRIHPRIPIGVALFLPRRAGLSLKLSDIVFPRLRLWSER